MSTGSGAYIATSIPAWAGVRSHIIDKYPPFDAWTYHFGYTGAGFYVASYGRWPGDPRPRWLWPHYLVPGGPPYVTHCFDAIMGDGVVMNQATFMAGTTGVTLASELIPFSPYP